MTLHPYELRKIGSIGEQFDYDVSKMNKINQKAVENIKNFPKTNSTPLTSLEEINADEITP